MQPSVRTRPKIRANGQQPTEKGSRELVLNCQFSESQSRWQWFMCNSCIVGRHQQVKSVHFKFEKNLPSQNIAENPEKKMVRNHLFSEIFLENEICESPFS